ncbi:hypothetical protein DSO57_1015604 [Entomophthora muscae]|uniref:Uncharacterized protein n=1 Tax=Entomophthora muscae TaxID=34485 RepID=A0ACC2SI58_9FUNG|nr:hypothetical protein DSO57_1015604 [Entomophthora muscae]
MGNKEADLYLTPDPYVFDLFSSHLASSSAPVPFPDPIQGTNFQANQYSNLGLEQLPANSQLSPPTANQATAPAITI